MKVLAVAVSLLVGAALTCDAFVQLTRCCANRSGIFASKRWNEHSVITLGAQRTSRSTDASCDSQEPHVLGITLSRRNAIAGMLALTSLGSQLPAGATIELVDSTSSTSSVNSEESMFAPKFVQQYEDFTQTSSGMSYRDVTPGTSGEAAKLGDRVVYDWSGYTIGYFGRPFQAKGGPQGGAFDKDLDYERTVLGSGKVVKGLEEAMLGMKAGGVRQVIVPFGALSYPQAIDPSHEQVGPRPTTFSGQRALNFVLDNPRLDRTLLFNVKVIRVDKPNAQGGFVRG